MSKRIVAGITMALMVALAGCQAPAGTVPQSQMTMRQLPKASKTLTSNKAQLGSIKMEIKGNFGGNKGRSLLYTSADVDRLTIDITHQTDFNVSFSQELTRANGQIGGATITATQGAMPAGTYDILVTAYEDGNATPIGGNLNATPVQVTVAAGESKAVPVTVELNDSVVQGASVTTNITLQDGNVVFN